MDFDLDGNLDFLHFPDGSTSHALMLQTTAGSFTNYASTIGFDTDDVVTGITADFDADGDVDVFQADPASSNREHYLESWDTSECPSPPCAAGEDDPANDWVQVSLTGHAVGTYKTDTITNTDLIGTRVKLSSGPAVWIQSEAGSSSGVGMPLSFGYSGTQTLEVLWPNGHSTSHSVSANTSYELLDQSVPYVKNATVQVTKTLGIGTVSFEFDWKTVGPCTGDRVVITHVSGGGSCTNYATTLNRTAAQAQTQTAFNEYTHEVTWSDQDCHANCTFDVQVFSDNPVASSWSSKKRTKITSCLGG